MSEYLDLNRLTADPLIEWYYRTMDGGVSGSTSGDKLRSLLDSGTLTLDTEVWNSRLNADWIKLRDLLQGRIVPSEKAAEVDSEKAEWFYVSRGARIGPVSKDAIVRLVSQGVLSSASEIWHPTFGTQWKSVLEAGMAPTNSPPPIPSAAISDNLAWALALVPIIISVFKSILIQTTLYGLPIGVAEMNGANVTPVLYYPPLLGFILNSVLCIWDTSRLKRAGWQISSLMLMGLFLTPIYLFVRASKLKHAPYYAYAWLVCFVLTLIW